jgi:5-oxoprolinase (ATP-hydrolysing) subunit A
VRIDLNADIGEGFPDDDVLLGIVTSANVACGFHAGSLETMRAACAAAAERGVVVGAHPSYRDAAGFGRRDLDVAPHVVRAEVDEQVGTLAAIALAQGARLGYVKPHGALYHRATVDADCAAAIVAVAQRHGLALLGWSASELLREAEAAGAPAAAEGFADRGYRDGALVPRGRAGAVLGPDAAAEQGVRLARGGAVASLCVHGDSPGAGLVAARVRAALAEAGFELRPFA